MVNTIEIAVDEALKAPTDQTKRNKAYLEFIKANFMIPVKKQPSEVANLATSEAMAEPVVLYLDIDNQALLPVFSNMSYFDQWAFEIRHDIQILELSGVDLLKGLGDRTIVCLNIGSPIYKEFNPDEIARMKSITSKIFSK